MRTANLFYNAAKNGAWLDFVAQHEKATFFHLPEYLKAIDTVSNYKPIVISVCENNKILALMTGYKHTVKGGILSRISSRIVIPQIPIYDDERSLSVLLERFKQLHAKNAIYTEIRAMTADTRFAAIASEAGFKLEPHLNSVVSCMHEQNTWKAISESKRRQIKKALKSGVTVEENPTESQIIDFYEILQQLYKTKIKKPLIELGYFIELMKLRDSPFRVKFLLVMYENSVIGGIVAPISNNRVIHEHYVAGLDSEYKNQYPSIVATWAAIDYACRNGIAHFDFMGAGKPDEEYGVRDFKLKFGGELIEPGRYEYIPSRLLYMAASKGFALYQRIIS